MLDRSPSKWQHNGIQNDIHDWRWLHPKALNYLQKTHCLSCITYLFNYVYVKFLSLTDDPCPRVTMADTGPSWPCCCPGLWPNKSMINFLNSERLGSISPLIALSFYLSPGLSLILVLRSTPGGLDLSPWIRPWRVVHALNTSRMD